MDPQTQPAMIDAPTLAAAALHGAEDLETVVASELKAQADRLPLQDFCETGGWVAPDGQVDVALLGRTESDDGVTLTVQLDFEETVNMCCAGDANKAPRTGMVKLKVRGTSPSIEVFAISNA